MPSLYKPPSTLLLLLVLIATFTINSYSQYSQSKIIGTVTIKDGQIISQSNSYRFTQDTKDVSVIVGKNYTSIASDSKLNTNRYNLENKLSFPNNGNIEPSTRQSLPNLFLYNFTMSSTAWNTGGVISASVSVANNGGVTSPSFNSRIDLIVPDGLGGIAQVIPLTDAIGFPSIIPNNFYTVSGNFVVPNVADGIYFVGVAVDIYNQVAESNESDNNIIISNQVTITNPQNNKPDLVPYAANFSSLVWEPGQTISAEVQVSNIGPGFANSSSSQLDLIQVDGAGNILNIITLASPIRIGSINPGAILSSGSFQLTVPNVPEGNYLIGLQVDIQNELQEVLENNNAQIFTNGAITILSPTAGTADLIPVELVFQTANWSIGQTINGRLTIMNIGNETAAQSVAIVDLVTPDFSQSYPVSGPINFNQVPAGVAGPENFQFTLNSVPNGTYLVGARVDVNNQVQETNENNNVGVLENFVVNVSNGSGGNPSISANPTRLVITQESPSEPIQMETNFIEELDESNNRYQDQLKRRKSESLYTSVSKIRINSKGLNRANVLSIQTNEMDVSFQRTYEKKKGENHFSWAGSESGSIENQMLFVSKNGTLSGTIWHKGDVYEIEQLDEETGILSKLKKTQYGCQVQDQHSHNDIKFPTYKSRSNSGDRIIDVLVVYTPSAAAAGGNIESKIELAVEETNLTYFNSNIDAEINLVGMHQTNYSETGSVEGDLSRLAQNGEGFMDEVHSIRDQVGADVVVGVFNEGCGCGLANQIGSDSNTAFCMVDIPILTGSFVFGHEIGHLQFARHDLVGDPTMTIPYAHGYYNTSLLFETVMSYHGLSNSPSRTRVPVWSNPNLRYNGAPMGTFQFEHNSRVLNESATILSSFKQSTNPVTGGENQVIVSNIGGGTLSITNITSNQPWLSTNLTSLNLSGGSSGAIDVLVNFDALGSITQEGTLSITSNDPVKPSISIEVVAVPSGGSFVATPVAIQADLVTDKGFRANWSEVSNASYILDIAIDNSFINFVEGYQGRRLTTTSWNVNDLESNQLYFYRVRATDGVNTSDYSNTISITTSVPANLIPDAAFSANRLSGAAPVDISFMDESTGADLSYLWSFPGGSPTTSTLSNPTVRYESQGVFNVHLTVSNSFGSESISKEGYINISGNEGYCTSNAQQEFDSKIIKVAFNSINNESDGCDVYSDFTSISTLIGRGEQYTLEITSGDCDGFDVYNHSIKAYIDWNNDGDFDDNKELILEKGLDNVKFISIPVLVPDFAKISNTRMRIVCDESGLSESCGQYSFGETEDYGIEIRIVSGVDAGFQNNDFIVFPNPTTGRLFIEPKADIAGKLYTCQISDLTGKKHIQKEGSIEQINRYLDLKSSLINSGVYILQLSEGSKISHIEKIIRN